MSIYRFTEERQPSKIGDQQVSKLTASIDNVMKEAGIVAPPEEAEHHGAEHGGDHQETAEV